MKYKAVFAIATLALGMLLFVPTIFAEEKFTPSDEQILLLKKGVEQAGELKEYYSNLTLDGVTEYYDSNKPKEQQRLTGAFHFIRLGQEHCLLEVQMPNPTMTWWDKSEMIAVCRLINPKASYQFLGQGQDEPIDFVLGEKITIKDNDHLVRVIDDLVLSNWQTGSAPYRVTSDLLLPFDILESRKAKPRQGGYIKGITENIIEGESVVTLKMGYYYGNTESNGEVSFYSDHYWAVKSAMAEGITANTGKISSVYTTDNVYEFTDKFPKLIKTTLETRDAESKELIRSQVSTISDVDFTPPGVELFDPKQYVGGTQLDGENFALTKMQLSPIRIVFIIAGLMLMIWGLWMRFTGQQK